MKDMITLLVGILVLVAAVIPVTASAVTDANLTGTTATVVGLFTLFLGIAGLAMIGKFASSQ